MTSPAGDGSVAGRRRRLADDLPGRAPALFIERGAVIEPQSYSICATGPHWCGREATVQAFTRVVGPCVIGEASSVTSDRIAASSIGDHCKVHGELTMSIVLGLLRTNRTMDSSGTPIWGGG